MQKFSSMLVLEDGSAYRGFPVGAEGLARGELCFTTAMTGYQHSISDPSFAGQILLFTFPHIGNVGVNDLDHERANILLRGIVMREEPTLPHHFQSHKTLDSWLKELGIVGIGGVDTRALTHQIRRNGTMNCLIASNFESRNAFELEKFLLDCPNMKGSNLMDEALVHTLALQRCNPSGNRKVVAVVDFGAKQSICSFLEERFDVVVVPGKPGFLTKILEISASGIVLSNGPGDPDSLKQTIVPEVKKLVETGLPIFAICLGHQLLALAYGCSTVKMHHGHRGINHPVYCQETKRVLITSHNHGFMVDPLSLPSEIEITHKSLFDDCVEGIRIRGKPIFSVQYHPEASPGTSDALYLFDRFSSLVDKC